jgi:hypothetical protein
MSVTDMSAGRAALRAQIRSGDHELESRAGRGRRDGTVAGPSSLGARGRRRSGPLAVGAIATDLPGHSLPRGGGLTGRRPATSSAPATDPVDRGPTYYKRRLPGVPAARGIEGGSK